MSPVAVLVGPPGAGKSTVGAAVAARLGVGFRDTDGDVEQATGRSISDLFLDEGEPAFRALEEEAVARALEEHDGVLAVGGGAVLAAATRDRLRGHFVVFLDVTAPAAAARVGFAQSRPLLVVNPRAELKRLLAERRPFYEAVATLTVSTDDRTVDDVVEDIVRALGSAA